ncbi:MAG: ABC transporter substrate-binding protein [Planctomycetota bacterium]
MLACLCHPAAGGEPTPTSTPAQEAFFRAREHQTEYSGPGREEPEPTDIAEVRIGYFGPGDPSHSEGGDLWLAAEMAVEEANRRGGYQGKPFRLVPGWSENPWGTGVRQVVRMAYTEKVWAIVGGIDGPSTHLAEQVAVKARLALLSPASTDKTVNLTNVPWMFSLAPGDHLQAPVMAAAIQERLGREPFVLVSAEDHDSHLFAVELGRCFAAREMMPSHHFKCSRTAEDLGELIARVVRSKPHAVVLIAGPDPSARLVTGLRTSGFTGLLFGGPAMGRQRFRQLAGGAAEGVLFPLLYRSPTPSTEFSKFAKFAETFQERSGRPPDYAAAHTYDAVALLVAAIRKSGLNRARIRDAVAALSPFPGVTGPVEWDPSGSNTRAVSLGTIRDGHAIPFAVNQSP